MSAENISEQNKALIRRWFEEVWNQGRVDTIGKMFARNGVTHGLLEDAEPLRGPAGLGRFHAQLSSAFPTIQVVVEDQIAEGDKVATRYSMRAKPLRARRELQGPVMFSGVTITRIKDGKIVEAWNNFELMDGLLPSVMLSRWEGPGCRPPGNDFWRLRRRR